MQIRQAQKSDWPKLWPILQAVFASGDTYPNSPDTTEEDAYHYWLVAPQFTYLAEHNGDVLGTYYLKPNQKDLGAHVCNTGYMVSPQHRGKGVGRKLGEHSLQEAKRLGFKAMQYNLVVSTNAKAVHLWQDLGFEIVGTLPKAFHHKDKGFVDAYVMYQWLG